MQTNIWQQDFFLPRLEWTKCIARGSNVTNYDVSRRIWLSVSRNSLDDLLRIASTVENRKLSVRKVVVSVYTYLADWASRSSAAILLWGWTAFFDDLHASGSTKVRILLKIESIRRVRQNKLEISRRMYYRRREFFFFLWKIIIRN